MLIEHIADSAATRQWRQLGARSFAEARGHMVSLMRAQVGFAAAVGHARLRLSRLELMGHAGRTAGRHARGTTAHTSPTVYEQVRGGPLGAGGGRAGFAGGGML